MKLVELTNVSIEVSMHNHMELYTACDHIAIREVKSKGTYMYNIDHILHISTNTIHEETLILRNEIISRRKPLCEVMYITFINGDYITVRGTLETLTR